MTEQSQVYKMLKKKKRALSGTHIASRFLTNSSTNLNHYLPMYTWNIQLYSCICSSNKSLNNSQTKQTIGRKILNAIVYLPISAYLDFLVVIPRIE